MSNHSKHFLILILALFWAFASSCDKERVNAPVGPGFELGDINLNGLANEVADAVLYSNYFVYGSGVFSVDPPKQIAASDVNDDGTPLTVADLVYLTRIVIGDALPYRQVVDTMPALFRHTARGLISVMGNVKIGAAFVVVSGNENPILLANEMEMKYAYDGTNTSILVWGYYECFTGDFMVIDGEIVSLEMATFEGHPVKLVEYIPQPFFIYQWPPGPFTTETSIYYGFSRSLQATLTIQDQKGKVVYELSRYFPAGGYLLVWNRRDQNGRRLPAGIYYCTLTSGLEQITIELLVFG